MTLAASLGAAGESVAAPFDGRWSVLVITDRGTCDVYRWNLGVRGGRVTGMEQQAAKASGRISNGGRVNLTFRRGRDVLRARGRLRGAYGNGTWVSASRKCAGRWRAERL